MTRKRYSLRTFVYRVLALRLLAVCVLVAGVFGSISYFRAYDRIGEDVLQHARNEIEWIRYRVRELVAESKLPLNALVEQAMYEDTDRERDLRHGSFIVARFYYSDAEIIASWQNKAANLEQNLFTQLQARPLTVVDQAISTRVKIGDQLFLEIRLPFITRNDRTVIAHALFAVSADAQARARRDALTTVGYVVLIVFVTTLILYPIILGLMRRLARYSEGLLSSNLETLQVLGNAIAKKDSDTDAHNYRVTLYAVHIAEAVGLNPEQIRSLIKGAFLHDVGKIGIRDDILLKPGRLNEDEFNVMKMHVDHGLDIVARSKWLDDAIEVVGSHHEKYNGSGYPSGKRGQHIPIGARIFAIADVFDALASQRPYKEPFSFQETMQILEEGRGSHFDPKILDGFSAIAKRLYQNYCGRDDPGLREELDELVKRYFSGGMDMLS